MILTKEGGLTASFVLPSWILRTSYTHPIRILYSSYTKPIHPNYWIFQVAIPYPKSCFYLGMDKGLAISCQRELLHGTHSCPCNVPSIGEGSLSAGCELYLGQWGRLCNLVQLLIKCLSSAYEVLIKYLPSTYQEFVNKGVVTIYARNDHDELRRDCRVVAPLAPLLVMTDQKKAGLLVESGKELLYS